MERRRHDYSTCLSCARIENLRIPPNYQVDRTSRPLEEVSEDNPGEYIVFTAQTIIDKESRTFGEPYKLASPGRKVLFPTRYASEDLGVDKSDRPDIVFSPVADDVEFPEPRDLDVNMMPFVYGEPESLPGELRPYYINLVANCPIQQQDLGKVMYLTVQENQVEKGTTQRRPGLHVEAPGAAEGISGGARTPVGRRVYRQ
jgi:hypothetical protein